jgi:hypothetical protein
MTVLQRNDVTGVDLGKLGRILTAAAIVAAFAAGAVYGLNVTASPTQTQTQTDQVLADSLVERFQDQFFAEANALNKADIGVPSASAAPFMAGTSTPTHTGRSESGASSTQTGDKADLIFKQKAAELTDPADRIHKQQAADLAD